MTRGYIPDRRSTGRMAETVRRTLGSLPRAPGQSRRVYDDGLDNGPTGGNGTGGSGCCCDELDCLKVEGYSGVITPAWYEFHAPSFRCHCDPDTDAGEKVKLYPTDDPDIWESEPIRCASGTAGEPCTNTATHRWHEAGTNVGTWTWTQTSPCTNTKTWFALWPICLGSGGCSYISVSNGEGGFYWVVDDDSQCLEGCECAYNDDEVPVGAGEFGAGQCTPSPATLAWVALYGEGDDPSCCTAPSPSISPSYWGQTTTTECTVGEESFAWVLTNESEPGTCEPPYPEEDGTEVDETTTTDCEYPSGWSLISETDEGCCTPPEPDFEGAYDGQEAETTCDVEEGDTVYGDAFWRLAIVTELGYYGCDETRLDFIIVDEEDE